MTGGTTDKLHGLRSDGLCFAPDGPKPIPELFLIGRCHFPVARLFMLTDSPYLEDESRKAISRAVSNCPENAFVITHGTGTMGETARYLEGRADERTVVPTGAMRRFSLCASDGEVNLGGAVVAAQILASGV